MLITCEDCGAEVSDQAISCIKCGRPMGAPHDLLNELGHKVRTHRYVAREIAGRINARMATITFWIVALGGFFWSAVINIAQPAEVVAAMTEAERKEMEDLIAWALVMWIAIGMIAKRIYVYVKSRPYLELAHEELRSKWLEVGGFGG